MEQYSQEGRMKSRCVGQNTLSTSVDGEMRRWVNRQAERAGVSQSELLRRVLEYYRVHKKAVNAEVDL